MEKFFRVNDILVDVEKGLIIDTRVGSQIEINLTNFTIKGSTSRTKLSPLRIDTHDNNMKVLWWNDKMNNWSDFNFSHGADTKKAIDKYVNIKFEEDLLG